MAGMARLLPPACALLTLLCLVPGCDRHEAEAPAADPADAEASDAEPQRIVTLAPALTQMLVDLGADDRLVGVAEHDAAAPPAMDLPVVGHFIDVDTEALLQLRPTHVLTMRTKDEPPARLRDLADAGHFELIAYPYPETIEGVLATLHGGPDSLGSVLEMPEQAAQLEREIREGLERLRGATEAHAPDPPRVLMAIGTRNIMASGPDTVLDELLRIAGGRNAAAEASVTAPTYDREALTALAPDVILLLLPDAPPLSENDPRIAELRGLPVPAVEHDRVHLIADPLVLLPSTNLVRIAAVLAETIHPELADDLTDEHAPGVVLPHQPEPVR